METLDQENISQDIYKIKNILHTQIEELDNLEQQSSIEKKLGTSYVSNRSLVNSWIDQAVKELQACKQADQIERIFLSKQQQQIWQQPQELTELPTPKKIGGPLNDFRAKLVALIDNYCDAFAETIQPDLETLREIQQMLEVSRVRGQKLTESVNKSLNQSMNQSQFGLSISNSSALTEKFLDEQERFYLSQQEELNSHISGQLKPLDDLFAELKQVFDGRLRLVFSQDENPQNYEIIFRDGMMCNKNDTDEQFPSEIEIQKCQAQGAKGLEGLLMNRVSKVDGGYAIFNFKLANGLQTSFDTEKQNETSFDFDQNSKPISQIQMYHDNRFLFGMTFLDAEGQTILKAGNTTQPPVTIDLAPNERLIGLKYKVFKQSVYKYNNRLSCIKLILLKHLFTQKQEQF